MNPVDTDSFQQAVLAIRKTYLDGLPEKFDRMENLLLEIEKSGRSKDAFEELFRAVHSMKGSGGSYGLHILTTICHQFEDLLSATRGGEGFTKTLISISLNYVDLLRLTAEQYHSGNEVFDNIEAQLKKLRERINKNPFTILLIDNSKLSTELYKKILSDFPAKTVVMNDGPNALIRALTEPFDLIVTTYEIPVLNGMALIGAVKLSDTKNRKTKTILITSNRQFLSARNRATDPDHTLFKDEKLIQNLTDAIQQALPASGPTQ